MIQPPCPDVPIRSELRDRITVLADARGVPWCVCVCTRAHVPVAEYRLILLNVISSAGEQRDRDTLLAKHRHP